MSSAPLSKLFLINLVITGSRYLVIAGGAYVLFWMLFGKRLNSARIQKALPVASSLKREFGWSLSTIVIFAMVGVWTLIARERGWTRIYPNVSDYGWSYFFLSIVLMLLLHDVYFYFTHRLMHHPLLFKTIHRVHHLSTNPSPWAAYSFHPLEAIVEAGIFPLIAFVLPVHFTALISFVVISLVLNVLGHLGFELYPRGFVQHRVGRHFNTSTHHNMHHQFFNSNFGLYMNWWDWLLRTNHPRYFEHFDEITAARS